MPGMHRATGTQMLAHALHVVADPLVQGAMPGPIGIAGRLHQPVLGGEVTLTGADQPTEGANFTAAARNGRQERSAQFRDPPVLAVDEGMAEPGDGSGHVMQGRRPYHHSKAIAGGR